MSWSKSITDWQRSTFGEVETNRALGRAAEEWSELWHSHSYDNSAEEAADVVITLAAFVSTLGFDLAELVERKMAKNRARKWLIKGDGTGYHIKDAPAYVDEHEEEG